MERSMRRSATILAVKFCLLAPICLVAWLYILPFYAEILAYAAALVFRHVLGYERVAVGVEAAGFLNTRSALQVSFSYNDVTMPNLGHLVANVAPFAALIFATPQLKLWRRLLALFGGVSIIFVTHVATLALRLSARDVVFGTGRTPLSTTIGFFSVTLPFLLWIVLAYWGHLSCLLAEEPEKPAGEQPD